MKRVQVNPLAKVVGFPQVTQISAYKLLAREGEVIWENSYWYMYCCGNPAFDEAKFFMLPM